MSEETTVTKQSKLISSSSTSLHKKKPKVYDPLVWILNSDPIAATHWLCNKFLDRSIKNGIQILIDVRFWTAGIRNKRAFAYWFDENRASESMERIFRNYSFSPGSVLKFTFFTHRTTKWARKCKEHLKLLEDFVWNGVCEWSERTGKTHFQYDLAEYLCQTNPTSEQIPPAHLKNVYPEWKNIPPQYRQNDIYKAFRIFYAYKIGDPFEAYAKSKVEIPEFLLKNSFV